MIQSKHLAEEATSIYSKGKEFLYDHVVRDKVIPIDRGTATRINVKVNAQRRSLKGILLLFMESYAAGARDSEKYIFPDIKKISVTINGSPNMIYNNGIESRDIWSEVSRFFMKEKEKPQFMNLQKFYTDDKFGLLIDLRSMARRNARQRHPPREHNRRRAAGNRERRHGVRNCELPTPSST